MKIERINFLDLTFGLDKMAIELENMSEFNIDFLSFLI